MKSAPRILLVSNSTVYGRGYLDHVEQQIKAFLGEAKRILFFPYALYDLDGYAAQGQSALCAPWVIRLNPCSRGRSAESG